MAAESLPGARVVKAFNAILASDLPIDDRPSVATGLRALPTAGDDAAAKTIVAGLHREIGFETVDAGPLMRVGASSARNPPIACLGAALREALAGADPDKDLPRHSWKRSSRV